MRNNGDKSYQEIKEELKEERERVYKELEEDEANMQKRMLESSYEADGLPGNLLERNIGLATAIPNILLFFSAPTAIVIAFSVFVTVQSFIITLAAELLFYIISVVLFTSMNTYMGNRYSKIGGYELIVKPIQKTIFSFNKLFVFLIIASIIPAVVSEVDIDIPTLKPIMFAFLGAYFIDLIASKIIKYLKDNVFYDPIADKATRKKLNIIELIECVLSILVYGLVLFPLSLKGEKLGITFYIIVVVLLAVIFTIVDRIMIKKQDDFIENISKNDEVEIYDDTVTGYKILAYILFALLHLIVIIICCLAWIEEP